MYNLLQRYVLGDMIAVSVILEPVLTSQVPADVHQDFLLQTVLQVKHWPI